MSSPFKLFRLQTIDAQIDGAKQRIREIEDLIKADQALRQAEKEAEKTRLEWQKAQKSLRQAEDAVHAQRLKIEQSEASLYSGRMQNPKELQDLQKEIVSLKKYLVTLEDRQLEGMLVEEEASAAAGATAASLEKIRSEKDQQDTNLSAERERLLQDIARLQGERQATISTIPPADLEMYEKLRQIRRGIAVSRVTNNACSACGSTLNTALLHAARSPNQITRCDMCGRILYTG